MPGVFQRIYYFVQTVKPSISMSRTCYPWNSMTTSKVNFKEASCFGGLMVKTLSCGLRDPGSIPGQGSFLFYFLFLATKTPCLQSPPRQSLLLERCHPDLSCCPCSLPMVCANRSHWCLALRTCLRNYLWLPWRVLYPQWPKGIPHSLRERWIRCHQHDATTNWTTHVHLVIERTPIMFYYAFFKTKVELTFCSQSLFSLCR